jgi:hypothetical protein
MLLPDCRERHSVVKEKEDERQRAYRIKRPGKRVTGNWWSDKWLETGIYRHRPWHSTWTRSFELGS